MLQTFKLHGKHRRNSSNYKDLCAAIFTAEQDEKPRI